MTVVKRVKQQENQMNINEEVTTPKVTLADIEENIVSEYYFTAFDGALQASGGLLSYTDAETPLCLLTFCVFVLRNGFTVTGEASCVSPENFDPELGRKIARQKAVEKTWPLMGYELRSRLASKNSQRCSTVE